MKSKAAVIVTGASRGIGAATTRWLAAHGCHVCLVSRSETAGDQLCRSINQAGGSAVFVAADVADPIACNRVVQKTVQAFGSIDAVVNNAGVAEPISPVAKADPEAWKYAIEVNLLGPFNMVRASMASLKTRNGRVVNVSSGAANVVIRGASAYCASKAALNHFTRVLAAEEPDITSVCVRPGVVDTDMQTTLRTQSPASMPAEEARFYQDLKTRGRLEPPSVPGRAVAWLSLFAPVTWSGSFLDYDDSKIAKPAKKVFGEDYPEGWSS